MTSSVLIDLELMLRNPGGFDLVSFVRLDSPSGMQVSIGGEGYEMHVATKTTVAPPGEPAEHGITVLAGTYDGERGPGSILIAVNCGQEPPVLQISSRAIAGAVQAWSWEITHDIQHRILDVFSDCG